VVALVNHFDNAGELLYKPTCIACRTIYNRFEIKFCKCKTAYYCSRECHKTDWRSHKRNCEDARFRFADWIGDRPSALSAKYRLFRDDVAYTVTSKMMNKVRNFENVHLVDFLHIESLESGPELVSVPFHDFLADSRQVLKNTMYRDDPENLNEEEIQMLVDDVRREEFRKVVFVERVTRFHGRTATGPRPVRQDLPFDQVLPLCASP